MQLQVMQQRKEDVGTLILALKPLTCNWQNLRPAKSLWFPFHLPTEFATIGFHFICQQNLQPRLLSTTTKKGEKGKTYQLAQKQISGII